MQLKNLPRQKLVSIGLIFLMAFLLANIVNYQRNTIDTYQRYSFKTHKDFDDVMFDLTSAIRDYNYRITSINHIGEAIAKNDDSDFINVVIVNFCNVNVAKKFIQQSLTYILYMPCRIAVYEQDDETMIETYLLSEKNDLHKQVNVIIKNIVDMAGK